jgi:hypothetical protein
MHASGEPVPHTDTLLAGQRLEHRLRGNERGETVRPG